MTLQMKEIAYPIVFLSLAILLASCKFTRTKNKIPAFKNMNELKIELSKVISAENVNVNGKEVTTNGKTAFELEISITNAQRVPEADELKRVLGKWVAKVVKSHLKDTSEYGVYKVLFIDKQANNEATKQNLASYNYVYEELDAPTMTIGKRLTSEKGVAFGGAQFTKEDSDIICSLIDFTFVDTSSVYIRLLKKSGNKEEKLGEQLVDVHPYDNHLVHRMVIPDFYEAYGRGKFTFQVLSHDTVIASKDFETQ
jgi:hypothetical protein